MKLIIDIPDYNNLNDIQNGSIACSQVLRAVKNGIPYEEKPQGEWLILNGDKVCPYCRTGTSHNTNASIEFFQFCPYCGADMRGGRE